MKPYSPNTNKGRVVAGYDVHHRTADQPKAAVNAAAKALRHAARQVGKRQTYCALIQPERLDPSDP